MDINRLTRKLYARPDMGFTGPEYGVGGTSSTSKTYSFKIHIPAGVKVVRVEAIGGDVSGYDSPAYFTFASYSRTTNIDTDIDVTITGTND